MAIKKILFPTDFSSNSGNAFFYALNLAEVLGAEILLFHSYKYPNIVTDIPIEGLEEQVDAIEKNCRRQLSELIEYGKKINPSIQIDSIVLHGDFADLIPDIVKKREIDLIVMRTKGAGSLKAFIFGTNAAKIIEKASCPVFVIPELYHFESLQNILFPSEYFESDVKNIEYLAVIAAHYDATITIVNIADKEKLLQVIVTGEFEKEVRKIVQYPKIKFICLDGKDVNEGITGYAKKENIDLIVMTTRHRNKFEKLFDHSLTQQMAYHTSIPLLAFHTEEIFQKLPN